MGVVIEICIKYPGGPTQMRVTDMRGAILDFARRRAGTGPTETGQSVRSGEAVI